MGRNNQQRRAAKSRTKAKRARGHGAKDAGAAESAGAGSALFGGAEWGSARGGGARVGSTTSGSDRAREPTVEEQAAYWLDEAVHHLAYDPPNRARVAFKELEALASTRLGHRAVSRELASALTSELTRTWGRGWRPVELDRLVARRVGVGAAALLRDATAETLRRHAAVTVAPDWLAQAEEIEASVWWAPDVSYVSARASLDGAGMATVVPELVAALHTLRVVPDLALLGPLPGDWTSLPDRADVVDDRILARVRALLAKAESTTFEAEAETFTAGAQSLMARHSIDAAMLAASLPRRADDVPVGRRIGIDRPYEAPKVLLLDAVAHANRCRTVWSKGLGFVTVLGFETDQRAVEALFTSLLVQSTTAVANAGTRSYRGGQSRTRSFRASFLIAFARRIGERLQQATDEETVAARTRTAPGQDLVRVLAVRSEQVDASVEEMFPELVVTEMSRPTDAEGWQEGRRAADAATLFDQSRSIVTGADDAGS